MTGPTHASAADPVEHIQADADADAKIAELLGSHPDEMGVETSDLEDAGSPADGPPEQKVNDEEQDDEDPEVDEDDWDTTSQDEDDDKAEDDEPEGGRFVSDDGKVRLSDGRITTIAALKNGSLLQEDYSRKQQELSQYAQQTTAMQAQLKQQYEQVSNQAQVAMQIVGAMMPQEPDIRLAREDPVEYQQLKAEYDHMQGAVMQLMQHHSTVQEQQEQTTQQTEAAMLGREVESFLAAEPSLRDQQKWGAFREEVMRVGGEAYGIQPEDLGDIKKAWVLRALTDAMRYRRLKTTTKPKAQQKAQGKPKVRKPGRRGSTAEKSAKYREGLHTALKQTGRKDVADRLLEQLVD